MLSNVWPQCSIMTLIPVCFVYNGIFLHILIKSDLKNELRSYNLSFISLNCWPAIFLFSFSTFHSLCFFFSTSSYPSVSYVHTHITIGRHINTTLHSSNTQINIWVIFIHSSKQPSVNLSTVFLSAIPWPNCLICVDMWVYVYVCWQSDGHR